MIFRYLPNPNFILSPAGGECLEFHDDNGGVGNAFHQYGGIRLVNENLKEELINDRTQQVIYLLCVRSSRTLQQTLDDVNMALTEAGDFGEWELLVDQTRHGTGNARPELWLRLRATKVGQSMDWDRFFKKMDKLQGKFGYAPLGKSVQVCSGRAGRLHAIGGNCCLTCPYLPQNT